MGLYSINSTLRNRTIPIGEQLMAKSQQVSLRTIIGTRWVPLVSQTPAAVPTTNASYWVATTGSSFCLVLCSDRRLHELCQFGLESNNYFVFSPLRFPPSSPSRRNSLNQHVSPVIQPMMTEQLASARSGSLFIFGLFESTKPNIPSGYWIPIVDDNDATRIEI